MQVNIVEFHKTRAFTKLVENFRIACHINATNKEFYDKIPDDSISYSYYWLSSCEPCLIILPKSHRMILWIDRKSEYGWKITCDECYIPKNSKLDYQKNKWHHIFDTNFYDKWFDDETFYNNVLDNLCMLNLDFRKRKVSDKFVLIIMLFKEREYEIGLLKIIADFLFELYSLIDD